MPVGGNSYTWHRPTDQGPALLHVAELRHRRTQASGEMRHPLWVLDYNYTPGERVRVGSVNAPWIERPANVVHLYAPDVPYWEDVGREGQPLQVHCAYLRFADAGLLRLEALLPSPVSYARFFDDEGLVGNLLGELVRIAADEPEAGYWPAYARFFQVLACLHRATPRGGGDYSLGEARPSLAPPTFVERLHRYVHAHLADRITIAALAAEVGMSASALAHRYRAATGETPMTTVKRARLDLAKGLLAKGYRLKEIASQVGFADEFHLSKTFKQVEGVSPRAYHRAALTRGEVGEQPPTSPGPPRAGRRWPPRW